MKISLKELKVLISEAVDNKIQESPTGDIGSTHSWANLKYLLGRGHLEGSWRVIMTAMEETGGDPQRAMFLLKTSIAKLEIKLEKEPKPSEEEGMGPESEEDPVFTKY